QRLEGCERTDDTVNVVLLDQLLRLGTRGGGNACGVGYDQFDPAPCKRVVALLQKHRQRKFHLDAAGGERSGLGRQKADADRSGVLRERETGSRQAGDTRAGNTRYKLSSR